MKNLKEFKPLYSLIKEEKNKLILATILIFISEIANIFTGYLNGLAVENITKMLIKPALMYLGIYFIIEIICDSIINNVASNMLQKIESKLTRRLGFNAYKKALNLPAYGYEKTSSGEVINRITNDADTLAFAFGQLLNLFSSLVGSFILIFYIFINSYIIGIEIITFMIILGIIINKFTPLLNKVHKERKKEQDKFTSLTGESIRGIREIKTLGIKNNLIVNIEEIIKELYNKSSKEIDIRTKFRLITKILKALLEVLVFVTCIILMYYNKVSLSFFIAMTYYVYRYMYLIDELNSMTETYEKVLVSITRVNEIIENRLYEDDKFGNLELDKSNGIIEFKNVTFAYPDEENILNEFNIKLEPNKKIAIVGSSGGGKTTLFNLITRIFDVKEGEILLDNINIKDLTEESLRKNISIIRQEPFVFNRTIKENFEVIDKNITIEEIRKYTKVAYLDDYIMSLPKGYDTLLGEGGVNLSGGQKQRLAIARTLAKNSKVILFDEATSALDNNSQEYIKKTIDNLSKEHTIVIVAHRLSTIVDADIIHVIENGKVAISGTHKELMKNSKTYKSLYESENL